MKKISILFLLFLTFSMVSCTKTEEGGANKTQTFSIPSSIDLRRIVQKSGPETQTLSGHKGQNYFVTRESLLGGSQLKKIQLKNKTHQFRMAEVDVGAGDTIEVGLLSNENAEDAVNKCGVPNAKVKKIGPMQSEETNHLILEFTPSGQEKLNEMTTKNQGKALALVIQDTVIQVIKIEKPLSLSKLELQVPQKRAELETLLK